MDERFLARGDALPRPGEFDGLVSFGGAQSFLDGEPELLAEADLLRDTAEAGVPVLGICLGAQILASALGGEVRRDERRTVAWHELTPAVQDPLFGEPFPALHWNEDIFGLPPGAVELFDRPGNGVEAFRYGDSAWAVQFHPDVDRAALDGWYARYGEWLPPAGVDEAAARAADERHWAAHERAARELFTRWAALVRSG